MGTLKDLTILIYTYKRELYLKRLLFFFDKFKFRFKILILDSTPYDYQDTDLIKILKKKNIKHIKYDANIFFVDKIYQGSSYINTKYVVLCADDDFLNPNSLIECRDYLENNRDYSSAHSLYFNHIKENAIIKTDINFVQIYSNGSSSEYSTPLERVKNYLDGSTVYYPFYAVHRTNQFIKIWELTNLYACEQGLSELFSSSVSLIFGKMKVLNNFYSSREPNISNYWTNNINIINDIYSKEKIKRCIDGINHELSTISENEKQKNKKLLELCFENYVNKSIKKANFTKNNRFVDLIIKIKFSLRIRTRLIFFKNLLFNYGLPFFIQKYL